MTNKRVLELDAEFITYKAEAKASMDALEKKIDDGIEKLDVSIKAMKEESDAKFEELKQLILGMDKTKITRKPSKAGKHGHEERKSTKEAGD
ncbi:hypothetical protein Tco_1011885 [Tanacetum coccineum]